MAAGGGVGVGEILGVADGILVQVGRAKRVFVGVVEMVGVKPGLGVRPG